MYSLQFLRYFVEICFTDLGREPVLPTINFHITFNNVIIFFATNEIKYNKLNVRQHRKYKNIKKIFARFSGIFIEKLRPGLPQIQKS